MAVGQAPFATSLNGGDTPDDGNYAWEWWYKVQPAGKQPTSHLHSSLNAGGEAHAYTTRA